MTRQADYDQHRTAIAGNPDGTVQTISNEEMARIDNASMGMAALVRVYGEKEDRLVKYEEERHDTNLGVLWSVKCVVDGIQLGEATRASKQTAKNVAAWHAAKRLGLVVSRDPLADGSMAYVRPKNEVVESITRSTDRD
jgi:hypothetical protein